MSTAPKGGRFVAWCGFAVGSLLSTGGNILYTWMPHRPEGAPENWAPPENWEPSIWAQIGAASWSIMLLIAVEVLSRVQWPAQVQWKVARYGGVGVVAIGSAIISYGHLNHVLTEWNYGALGSAVGPIVIDGLMTICGFALLADAVDRTDVQGRAAGAVPTAAQGPRTEDVPNAVQPVPTARTESVQGSHTDVPTRVQPVQPAAYAPVPTVRTESAQGPRSDERDDVQPDRTEQNGTNGARQLSAVQDPERLEDRRQWAAKLGETPSAYKVRQRYGCGQKVADRLLEQLKELDDAGDEDREAVAVS